jgi:glycosyltransferase involved in cell wall biosynthesis
LGALKPESCLEDRMGALAFIATAWGPRFGGINAFNQDLCQAVAAACGPRVPILCFAFAASARDVEQARAAGVHLVPLEGNAGAAAVDVSRAHEMAHLAKDWGDVDWWIGHDVISGPVAIQAGSLTHSRVAVVQHTDYASYAALKGTSGQVILARDRAEAQTLLQADVLCGVGPKLAAAALDRVRGMGSGARVTELVPGLPAITPLETPPSTFRAITFGRLDPQSDRIKQGRLAVHAFARLVRDVPDVVGDDPRIAVIGVNADGGSGKGSEQDALMRLAASHAGRSVSVVGHPFTESRDVLFRALSDASVCLMLSVHEGFGLTGWEAIAAGVPLVLSRNSGLARRRGHGYGPRPACTPRTPAPTRTGR